MEKNGIIINFSVTDGPRNWDLKLCETSGYARVVIEALYILLR